MAKDTQNKGEGQEKKPRSLFSALLKDGTADGALGYGIAGGVMAAAGVIWTISGRMNGSASYDMYALLCLAIGAYCFVNMVKVIKKNRDKKDGRR